LLAMENGYPIEFVLNQIGKTLNRFYEKQNITSSSTSTNLNKNADKVPKNEQLFIDLPFV
ncbi:unnamed protein product, partial [Didymodactylos carnosus]